MMKNITNIKFYLLPNENISNVRERLMKFFRKVKEVINTFLKTMKL